MARQPYEPTAKDRQFVKLLTIVGVTQEKICEVIKVSHVTLRKYFREELTSATEELLAQAIGVLAYHMKQLKTKEALIAAMFTLKTRGGWRERGIIDSDVEALAPIKVEVVPSKKPKK